MGLKLTRDSNKTIKKVKSLRSTIETENRKSLYSIGKQLKSTANAETLAKPKTGRTYFISDKLGRRRKHIASSFGESWANKTGTARKGISYRVRGGEILRFSNNVPYVKYLENPRSLNRPAMFNAIKKNKTLNIRIIRDNINRGIR